MTKFKSWDGHSGPSLENKNGFDIIECSRCGFKHIVPIPSEEELSQIYLNDYYTIEKPLYIEQTQEDQEWWNIVYDGRFQLFESLLTTDRRDLVDIGSGPGFFLQRAKERGWNGVGIEPSVKAAEFSKELGLKIRNEFLTRELAEELGTFDVVYMHEVLEHIPDPIEILNIADEMINPGGLLCLIVPNDYNPFQKALKEVCNFPSWWVAAPHHINYFDLSALRSLVQRMGISIVDTEATFPIDLFLLMGDNYIGNDELGRKCHAKRKTLEINLESAGLGELKRTLYRSFAEVGIGREIQVIGRKELR